MARRSGTSRCQVDSVSQAQSSWTHGSMDPSRAPLLRLARLRARLSACRGSGQAEAEGREETRKPEGARHGYYFGTQFVAKRSIRATRRRQQPRATAHWLPALLPVAFSAPLHPARTAKRVSASQNPDRRAEASIATLTCMPNYCTGSRRASSCRGVSKKSILSRSIASERDEDAWRWPLFVGLHEVRLGPGHHHPCGLKDGGSLMLTPRYGMLK